LSSLEAKVVKEGEVEAKAYNEYIEWCDDASKNSAFDIKTAKDKEGKLEATIAAATSDIEAGTTKIEELAGSIASGEGELKDATLIRGTENKDFLAAEAELVDSIDTLDRAISILEREMAKNPALMQVDSTNYKGLVQALGAVINAASFSSNDKQKLLGLVQSESASSSSQDSAEAAEEDSLLGAPKPAEYKTHSTSIVDVLDDLKEKAESELSALRKAETNAQHNFDMLKQSLDDQMAFDKKNMGDEQEAKSAAEETKAMAEGDLTQTVKDLADAEAALATAQSTCMQVAADHEATMKGRAEELAVIAKAKQILVETSEGAVGQTYSLIQVSTGAQLRTRADLANAEVVLLVKRLAEKHHSAALAELASRISAVLRYGAAGGEDPFVKVKSLIRELIDRLLAEAHAEATEKAYCDEQMAKTEAKKAELEDDIAKLTAKIDKAASSSAILKEEVKQLQADLAALAKSQADMDKARQDEHAAYTEAKADLELGLSGVRKALDVLRDYYGGAAAMLQDGDVTDLMQQPAMPEKHVAAVGAGTGIINILEVVESDFAKNLAAEETGEADAVAQYEKITQENKITRSLKEQDVKYKTQEFKGLDKAISEYTSDRDTENEELTSVLDYYAKIKDRCIAKPETYEERKHRREAEIAGLKEALTILEGEAALVQRGARTGIRR